MLSPNAWSIQSPVSVQDSHKNAEGSHSLEFKAFMIAPIVYECGWKLELTSQSNKTCLIKKVASEMVVPQTDCGGLKRLQGIPTIQE